MNELIDFLKPYTTMIEVMFSLTIIIFLLISFYFAIWFINRIYDTEKEEKKRLEENMRKIAREEIWKREKKAWGSEEEYGNN